MLSLTKATEEKGFGQLSVPLESSLSSVYILQPFRYFVKHPYSHFTVFIHLHKWIQANLLPSPVQNSPPFLSLDKALLEY